MIIIMIYDDVMILMIKMLMMMKCLKDTDDYETDDNDCFSDATLYCNFFSHLYLKKFI